MTLLTLTATVEYNRLTCGKKKDGVFEIISLFAAALVPFVFYMGAPAVSGLVIFSAAFALFLAGMLGKRSFNDTLSGASLKTLGVVYIAWPLAHLVLLKTGGDSKWILFLLVVVWINDTFALITGKTMGRHKLSPQVSPNKTVEGALGGIIAGVMAGFIYNKVSGLGMTPFAVAGLSIAIGVAGIIGDLIESVIKRSAGAKDSGSIIPGHGGALDRIDSLIFPIPLIYYFLAWTWF